MVAAVGTKDDSVLRSLCASRRHAVIFVKSKIGRFVAENVDGDIETRVRIYELHGFGQGKKRAALHKQGDLFGSIGCHNVSSAGYFRVGPEIKPIAQSICLPAIGMISGPTRK